MRELLSASKLYAIGQRAEVFFDDVQAYDDYSVRFDLVSKTGRKLNGVEVDLSELIANVGGVDIASGPKTIQILDDKGESLHWFTVDRLLYDYWRGDLPATGLEDYRMFTDFDLHYVGISKQQDSFTRLFRSGHQHRARILSQERQLIPMASLTDEVFIFFFDIEPTGIRTMSETDIDDFADSLVNGWMPNAENVVADAEKALVNILDSEYNIQKYRNYPFSDDGLFSSKLIRFIYFIGEDITFSTVKTDIRGLTLDWSREADFADFIAVSLEDETVTLVKPESKND